MCALPRVEFTREDVERDSGDRVRLAEDLAGVDLLEVHAAEEPEGGGVRLVELDLDEGEELLLELAEQVEEEKLAEPLAAERRVDFEVADPGGRPLPAPGVPLHLPDEGPRHPHPGRPVDDGG